MPTIINAKTLREQLGQIVERVRKGERITVLYRSRPAFDIVPVGAERMVEGRLEGDSLYGAPAVGRSTDGHSAEDHDELLYG